MGLSVDLAQANTSWIITGNSNPYLSVEDITPDKIVLLGNHSTRQNQLRYTTEGFVMTRNPYNTSGSFPTGAINQGRLFVNKESNVLGDVTIVYYTMKKEDFIAIAAKLGITGESIGNGSVPVYLHTIYDTYNGQTRTAKDIVGLQEMLKAPITYRLGFEQWDPQTQIRLPSYYNMRFDLTASSTFKVKVVAVDEKGTIIKDNLQTKQVIYQENYTYQVSTANRNIIYQNNTYEYEDKWHYEYTNRKTSANVKNSLKSLKDVSIVMPDAMPGLTLTVYLRYKKKSSNYKVKVVAVDMAKKELMTLQAAQAVESEAAFDFELDPSKKSILNNTYFFQNQWSYSYKSNNTTTVNSDMFTGDNAWIYPLPVALENSTAVVYMYYAKDTPTLTPTPKPPSPSPTPKPGDPTPSPKPSPTPRPPIPEIEIPIPDFAHLPFTQVTATGKIRADVKNSERFDVTLGIPTTESLYGEVQVTDYLLGYSFEKKVGVKNYPIRVKKEYILEWMSATPDSAGGGKPVTEVVPVEYTVMVPRAFGYWQINNLEYYQIDNAVLNNYSLPSGAITIYPNETYYKPPNINYYHTMDEEYHIIPPKQLQDGITLPSETIKGETSKPMLPLDEFFAEAIWQANILTEKIKVRSDQLIFQGLTVISSEIAETEAPNINIDAMPQCYTLTDEQVLYKPNQIIEATKLNGVYGSTGVITYRSIAAVKPTRFHMLQYSITGINQVILHTPVICKPTITADNDKYVQLINPTDSIQLVLDPDPNLSDFTVNISNFAHHSDMRGYYIRDFSRSIRDPAVSYIASKNGILRNEVQFPFDVYLDIGNDNDTSNDEYITAGTWIVIGRSSPRFYLPMWTIEDVYTVNFRTTAVNGENFLDRTQPFANTGRMYYVATESLQVEVSGRIYGLTMYDLSDYPIWEEVFRIPKSLRFKKDNATYPDGTKQTNYNKNFAYTYTVGTNDQYGNDTGRNIKFTFPLVNGSHPRYSNMGVLKTGYISRFSLETTGTMYADACKVIIKPTFYYVDAQGKNRTEVDLYYTEEINGKSRNLVKMGSPLDLTNMKSTNTGDLYLGISEVELKQTAIIRELSYGRLLAKREALFTFTDIRLNYAFRTFVNSTYRDKIKALSSYQQVLSSGIKENDIIKQKQKWYGQYYLPNEIHAVKKGFDVMDYADKYGVKYTENFWLKEGYIIVNFNIYTVNEYGDRRLSYINANNYQNKGHCSMWIMEGPPLTKKDNKGVNFNFFAGDFIIYYANKRMSSDYSPRAIY